MIRILPIGISVVVRILFSTRQQSLRIKWKFTHIVTSTSRCDEHQSQHIFFAYNLLPTIFGLLCSTVTVVHCVWAAAAARKRKETMIWPNRTKGVYDKHKYRTMDEPQQPVVCATSLDDEFSVLRSIQNVPIPFRHPPYASQRCVFSLYTCILIYVPIDCSMLSYIRIQGAYLTTIFRFLKRFIFAEEWANEQNEFNFDTDVVAPVLIFYVSCPPRICHS